MNAFEKAVYGLYQWKMNEPQMYGWFHILWIAVLACVCALICVFRKKISPKAIDVALIVWGAVLIVLEATKLTLYSFHYDNGTVTWAFDWGRFPFQFCSTPLYVAIPAGALKKGRIKNALLCFLATFSLFAGLISMFFPSGMFADFIFISLHTMIWHSSMVAVGVMLYVTNTVSTDLFTLLKGFIIFVIFVLVALILNLCLGHHQFFNMFYISPYEVTPLEVFDIIYQHVPYVIFLIIYIIAFSFASAIVFFAAKGIELAAKKIQTLRANKKSAASHEDTGE